MSFRKNLVSSACAVYRNVFPKMLRSLIFSFCMINKNAIGLPSAPFKLQIICCCPSIYNTRLLILYYEWICIHLIKSSLKVCFSNAVIKNRWLTNSKDFSISCVIKNPLIFKLFEIWRISEITLHALLMNLLLT